MQNFDPTGGYETVVRLRPCKYRTPRECVDIALDNWYSTRGKGRPPKIDWVAAETGLTRSTAADNLRAALVDRQNKQTFGTVPVQKGH